MKLESDEFNPLRLIHLSGAEKPAIVTDLQISSKKWQNYVKQRISNPVFNSHGYRNMKKNACASGSAALTELLSGRQIAHVALKGKNALRIVFADGTFMHIKAPSGGFTIYTGDADIGDGIPTPLQQEIAAQTRLRTQSGSNTISRYVEAPTERETDYLSFIKEHTARVGKPPAQYDMERRFQIPAHHAENAIREMERKGLITHKVGMPKSLRVCD